jgi:uncharacterized caspase-like protein
MLFLGMSMAAPSAWARVYLVSVGITDYSKYPSGPAESISNLNLPVADARAIASVYAVNASVDYTLLLNEKATQSRILKAINKLYAHAGAQDVIVFFFSGHGYAGGFCTYDGPLSYTRIRKEISKSKCPNKVILADACHAGGMRSDAAASSSSGNNHSSMRNANVMMFLAARNTEASIENPQMENGFFTTCLVSGLKGYADANGDRVVTARELYDYVHRSVVNMSRDRQHPVMWGKFSDNMPVMKWK